MDLQKENLDSIEPSAYSGWMDLNHRPDGSKPPALTKLRYTQVNE